MKFVFQEIQKEPKYPQLRRIYRFSHDCYMFRFLDLLPFTLSLFLHYIIWYLFQTVQHIALCSGLYFCLSLLAVQDIFPSLQCSALQCIQTIFIQFLFIYTFCICTLPTVILNFFSVILKFIQHKMLAKCYL